MARTWWRRGMKGWGGPFRRGPGPRHHRFDFFLGRRSGELAVGPPDLFDARRDFLIGSYRRALVPVCPLLGAGVGFSELVAGLAVFARVFVDEEDLSAARRPGD